MSSVGTLSIGSYCNWGLGSRWSRLKSWSDRSGLSSVTQSLSGIACGLTLLPEGTHNDLVTMTTSNYISLAFIWCWKLVLFLFSSRTAFLTPMDLSFAWILLLAYSLWLAVSFLNLSLTCRHITLPSPAVFHLLLYSLEKQLCWTPYSGGMVSWAICQLKPVELSPPIFAFRLGNPHGF